MVRTPRYLDLATRLRKAILSGKHGVGDQLPTEHAMCAQYNVSRHTARAALQVLEDENLIERRPGLGTRVISTGAPPSFSQPLGGIDDLLQYAHEAKLNIASSGMVKLSARVAQALGARKGSGWLMLEGVRIAGDKPIAATSIYISQAFGAASDQFSDPDKAITEHIEALFGVSVFSINQTIRAELLDQKDAGALGAAPGGPILRTTRRYYDVSERLFVISDSRHPAERFSYEMAYRRAAQPK
ncbi:MAG: GntR family transcriptional regulator [Pseudomonadota bacterium]